jgi:DNA-binding winged helix-turn-helix (wHTH) protein
MLFAADPVLASCLPGATIPVQGTSLLELRNADGLALAGEGAWDRLRWLRISRVRAGAVVVDAGAPPEDRARLEPVVVLDRVDQVARALGELRGTLATRIRLATGTADLDRARFFRDDGAEFALTALEVRLVAYLASRTGRTVERDELQRQVWEHAKVLPTKTVDMAIARLRKKIEPNPAQPAAILTVRGGGYRAVTGASAQAQVTVPWGSARELALAAEAALYGPDPGPARQALAAMRDELQHAFASTEEPDAIADLAWVVSRELAAEQRRQLIDEGLARTSGHPRAHARLLLQRARLRATREPAAALADLEQSRALGLPPDHGLELVLLEARLLGWTCGPAAARARLAAIDRRALPRAHALVVDAERLHHEMSLHEVPIPEGCERVAAIVEELVQLGSMYDAAATLLPLAARWTEVAPGRALPWLERLTEWAETACDPQLVSRLATALSAEHLVLGAFERAHAALQRAPLPSPSVDAARAAVLVAAGRWDEARKVLSPWRATVGGLEALAVLEIDAGNDDAAAMVAHGAVRCAQLTGDPALVARARLVLGLATVDPASARRALLATDPGALPDLARLVRAAAAALLGIPCDDSLERSVGPTATAMRAVVAAAREGDRATLARRASPQGERRALVRIIARRALLPWV